RAASEADAWVEASATGYGTQRLARPEFDHMAGVDHYLSPAPELVTNGGFEAQQAGWYAGGEARFVGVAFAYDGYCAQLGAPPTLATAEEPRFSSVSYLRQAVRIPVGVHAPTLGLHYALGAGQGTVGTLRALVGHAQGETLVWAGSEPTPWAETRGGARYPLWRYAYADLGVWSGQTVTLTLVYEAPWSAGTALVDQVSVAPWLTPRIDGLTPDLVPLGVETVVTIRGANLDVALAPAQPLRVSLGELPLAARAVADGSIQITVPPTVSFGVYDVWVTNPAGHRGVAPGGLTVGHRLVLPLATRGGD
ncbi:MAG: IPT/TIG domain-containing protein, partial [Chloroflexota bacterium]